MHSGTWVKYREYTQLIYSFSWSFVSLYVCVWGWVGGDGGIFQ